MDLNISEEQAAAGRVNKSQLKKLTNEIYKEVFFGLPQYCTIPEKFKYCRLDISKILFEDIGSDQKIKLVDNPTGMIYNPKKAHYEAVALFNLLLSGDDDVCEDRDPLRPKIGAYLVGPPGVGKTHLATAYAIKLKELLDNKVSSIHEYLDKEINKKALELAKQESVQEFLEADEDVKIYDIKSETEIEAKNVQDYQLGLKKFIEKLRKEIASSPYKPTDIVYISFDQLYEMYVSQQRKETLEALINTPVVFVDDIHPKGDEERANIISHIVERRYEYGKKATFITSNLDCESLGSMYNKYQNISQRLDSRFSEMFYTIKFTDCDDWRKEIGKLKIDNVKTRIAQELEAKGIV